MDGFAVHGIDVSHYQSYINWDTVAAQDITFAFVKATEGEMLQDTMFCENWDAMKNAGIKRGAYHFYRPSISPVVQAQNYIELVQKEYGDLPPVLDIEVTGDIPILQLIANLQIWLYLIEIQYNIKPIIYTNINFYNRYLAGHFDNYPLWIARYNDREPSLACGSPWHFWQYGNRGRIKGIHGNVDFNVFYGSTYQLEEICLTPKTVLSTR
jgi:lysozyme